MKSPSWAANYAERQEAKALERELALNRFIEAKNPKLRPTALYQEPPLPSSSVCFPTRAAWIRYETIRARGKYDPQVVFPTATGGCASRGGVRASGYTFHRGRR